MANVDQQHNLQRRRQNKANSELTAKTNWYSLKLLLVLKSNNLQLL